MKKIGHNKYYWEKGRNGWTPSSTYDIEMSVPEGMEFNKPYSLHELADKAMYGSQAEVFGEYTKPKLKMEKLNYEKQPTPDYYIGSVYGYEARKIIQDFKLSYNIGNVTSYLLRAGKKYEAGMTNMDKHIEDLIKAKNHIQFEIEELQLEQARLKHDEAIKSGAMVNRDQAPPLPILPDDTGKCISCEEKAAAAKRKQALAENNRDKKVVFKPGVRLNHI